MRCHTKVWKIEKKKRRIVDKSNSNVFFFYIITHLLFKLNCYVKSASEKRYHPIEKVLIEEPQ